MSDDLLARVTRAMRDQTIPVEVYDEDETLARIERSTRQGRVRQLRQRRFTRWIVMPMAASFLVFCAWASASGRLTQWLSSRPHMDAESRALRDPREDPRASAAAANNTHQVPSPSAVPSEVPSEQVAPTAVPSASLAPPLKPPAKSSSSPSLSPDVDALYRDAHDAHFVRKDPDAALAAWDRYLAAAGPSGRFTLEARYNRAITLVRLGRKTEAAAALRPFANGDYGGYRRDEARELLHTLE